MEVCRPMRVEHVLYLRGCHVFLGTQKGEPASHRVVVFVGSGAIADEESGWTAGGVAGSRVHARASPEVVEKVRLQKMLCRRS